jgi:hypothetical protein
MSKMSNAKLAQDICGLVHIMQSNVTLNVILNRRGHLLTAVKWYFLKLEWSDITPPIKCHLMSYTVIRHTLVDTIRSGF